MTGRTPGGTLQSKLQSSGAERHRSQPWRGGWPERPNGSQLFNLTPGCKPSTEKVRPVAPLRTGLLLENRDLRSRAPPPATGPSPKKNLARRSLTARLGDSFYFAISKIVESLLRRGARDLEGTALRGPRSLRRTSGASRHAVGAIRARNILCPRASEILFKRRTCV